MSPRFPEWVETERLVRILPTNRESFNLAKKLGFREEGVQRRAFRCGHGELHDVRSLAIVKEEWLSATQNAAGAHEPPMR